MVIQLSRNGRIWSDEDILADCTEATRLFRIRRLDESLEDYVSEFTSAETAAASLIDRLPELLRRPVDQELLGSIVGNPMLFTALRYLTAPPVSEDDLRTLLSGRVSRKAIRGSRELAEQLQFLLHQTLDPKRFSWILENQTATPEQRRTAVIATAVAMTAQRVQANRRSEEKKDLESAVEDLLKALDYQRVPTPREPIESAEDLPQAGFYMTNATLGHDNGDCVIGLRNRKRLVLECKSSNSGINSRKRLNKEVVKDAENWRSQFGNQVMTGAVLRGVFNPRYVSNAQETPLLIFWAHRLEDLREFITKENS
ncbi:XamI family restriction endonuclease [Massilia solisilvae]|uniref:XamI family restriction endonuclease n=1 Tax=Massilia solisilvae TaxID=1811225 RepID=A0ABT2BP41_9BURK|nr:XamI family restriction endonuclease [Massilia solisilvae]